VILPRVGKLTEFDASAYLDNEEVIAEYLTAALEDGDPDIFLAAVGNVAKARGMTQIACVIRSRAQGWREMEQPVQGDVAAAQSGAAIAGAAADPDLPGGARRSSPRSRGARPGSSAGPRGGPSRQSAGRMARLTRRTTCLARQTARLLRQMARLARRTARLTGRTARLPRQMARLVRQTARLIGRMACLARREARLPSLDFHGKGFG
jgi:addiction module antidote-like protein